MRQIALSLVAAVLATACGGPDVDATARLDQNFSSKEATLLLFEYDGELLTASTWNLRGQVESQMLYTIGQLNGDRAVGRLDKLAVTGLTQEPAEGGLTRIRYHARMPVGWGAKTSLPERYTFVLPHRADSAGQADFTSKYMATCVDLGAHDIDSGSMWYYYRPASYRCRLDDADVIRMEATVTVSDENTTGKYPEYHRVWEDGSLDVVAVFGKYEDGATDAGDAGIAAYNAFLREAGRVLGTGVVTDPAELPADPGVKADHVAFMKRFDEGHQVTVHALLVDNVRTAGYAFDQTYRALSTEADLVMYFGHSGLGANIRALAGKSRFRAGKYQIFFLNGCDTFAYVDAALFEAKARLNPEDPSGTQHLDMLTNVMPAYFHANARNAGVLIGGLLAHEAPKTYEQLFAGIDRSQVVTVVGEEDNVYFPGYGDAPPAGGWEGFGPLAGVVGRGDLFVYETPEVPAGRYRILLAQDPAAPGGDADLHVRAGSAPTLTAYDCRPYAPGSDESCEVALTAPGVIHVLVHGYAAAPSAFLLSGESLDAPPPPVWSGLEASGTLAKDEAQRLATPELPAGRYVFAMTGEGDADLYVRIGGEPTQTEWDCRPYAAGSNETCTLTLDAPAKIHVLVQGWAASSTFVLTGRPE